MTLECFKLSLNRLLLQPKSFYSIISDTIFMWQAEEGLRLTLPFQFSISMQGIWTYEQVKQTPFCHRNKFMAPLFPQRNSLLLIANALLAHCRVRFVFPKKFIFESFSMFDLIRGDHCNNTELEHFPSFYFPQEIYKRKS